MQWPKKDGSDSTLGVVAICYNEEKDLPGFISHLIDWVDEIILIDDGSSDRSEKIAVNAGPKVRFISSPRKQGEYYSHQRNKGIEAATTDWLLHMDIDERVTPELAQEILEGVAGGTKDAFRFRRLNFFLQKPMRGGGWQYWNLVHLARREVLRFSGMYHESIELTVGDNRVGQLVNQMWHLNDENYEERMRKSTNYCVEYAEALRGKGVRVKSLHLFYYPLREFVRIFLWKRGYRDGFLGLLFALHASTAAFRSCALLWNWQHPTKRDELEEELKTLWGEKGKTQDV